MAANLKTAAAEVAEAGLPATQFVVVREQGGSQVQDTSCRQSSFHCAVLHASFGINAMPHTPSVQPALYIRHTCLSPQMRPDF